MQDSITASWYRPYEGGLLLSNRDVFLFFFNLKDKAICSALGHFEWVRDMIGVLYSHPVTSDLDWLFVFPSSIKLL